MGSVGRVGGGGGSWVCEEVVGAGHHGDITEVHGGSSTRGRGGCRDGGSRSGQDASSGGTSHASSSLQIACYGSNTVPKSVSI